MAHVGPDGLHARALLRVGNQLGLVAGKGVVHDGLDCLYAGEGSGLVAGSSS